MLILFNCFFIAGLQINFPISDSYHQRTFTNNIEELKYFEDLHQSVTKNYKQINLENQIKSEEKNQEDKVSTLQTLLVIIPLLMIPTIIISFIFYKKLRNKRQFKKNKLLKKK